ncbi:MAG: Rep protein [Denitrovibrio sp.]|nr:MAG: Rep protein [Denitrovibrio sp.]
MKLEGYNERIIISGNVIEYYSYGKTQYKGKRGRSGRDKVAEACNKEKNRQVTLMRAKQAIMRTVNANIGRYGDATPKFVTLTFKDNLKELEIANNEFKKFKQRLQYKVKVDLAYICVPEFQKRGAVHYHVIFFNLIYIDAMSLREIWRNGFIKINKIDNVVNVGVYVAKYLNKDKVDSRLVGKKCYFTSRGLYKSEVIEDAALINQILDYVSGLKCTYETEFENEHVGLCLYKQYNTT